MFKYRNIRKVRGATAFVLSALLFVAAFFCCPTIASAADIPGSRKIVDKGTLYVDTIQFGYYYDANTNEVTFCVEPKNDNTPNNITMTHTNGITVDYLQSIAEWKNIYSSCKGYFTSYTQFMQYLNFVVYYSGQHYGTKRADVSNTEYSATFLALQKPHYFVPNSTYGTSAAKATTAYSKAKNEIFAAWKAGQRAPTTASTNAADYTLQVTPVQRNVADDDGSYLIERIAISVVNKSGAKMTINNLSYTKDEFSSPIIDALQNSNFSNITTAYIDFRVMPENVAELMRDGGEAAVQLDATISVSGSPTIHIYSNGSYQKQGAMSLNPTSLSKEGIYRCSYDRYQGEIILRSVDVKDPTKTLPYATFDITNTDDDTIRYQVTTDENGYASWKDLPLGNYTITQITDPEGYTSNFPRSVTNAPPYNNVWRIRLTEGEDTSVWNQGSEVTNLFIGEANCMDITAVNMQLKNLVANYVYFTRDAEGYDMEFGDLQEGDIYYPVALLYNYSDAACNVISTMKNYLTGTEFVNNNLTIPANASIKFVGQPFKLSFTDAIKASMTAEDAAEVFGAENPQEYNYDTTRIPITVSVYERDANGQPITDPANEKTMADNIYQRKVAFELLAPEIEINPYGVYELPTSLSTLNDTVYSGQGVWGQVKYNSVSSFDAKFNRFTGLSYGADESSMQDIPMFDGLIQNDYFARGTSKIQSASFTHRFANLSDTPIPAVFTSEMSSHETITEARRQIQVVPTDLQVCGVTVNNLVDGKLYYGQKFSITYRYYNNTSVPVYANLTALYSDNGAYITPADHQDEITKNKLIPAYSYATIQTKEMELKCDDPTLKVYAYSNISICGLPNGVFDTPLYEANWQNNERDDLRQGTVTEIPIVIPPDIRFNKPNLDYRIGTDVVTSFTLNNYGEHNIGSDDKLGLCMLLKQGDKFIGAYAQDFVMPGRSHSEVWFKWHVPEDAVPDVPVSITAFICPRGLTDEDTDAFINNIWSMKRYEWMITQNVVCQTPDTVFTPTIPDWYISVHPNASDSAGYGIFEKDFRDRITRASWNNYTENEDGTFELHVYNASITDSTKVTIKSFASPTAKLIGGEWFTRAGYGYTMQVTNTVDISDNVKDDDYTKIQNAQALFPEFLYRADTDKISTPGKKNENAKSFILDPPFDEGGRHRTGFAQVDVMGDGSLRKDGINNGVYGTFATMVWDKNTNQFHLPINTSTINNAHFIPIWMPDGAYVVKVYLYDCWTPGGALTNYDYSDMVHIQGSMYDDYVFVSYI